MQYLSDDEVLALEKKANEIRQSVIEMLIAAGSGHTAGPLDMADVFTLLYFHVLNHRPDEPLWPDRDRLVLSNGHICPVQYVTLAHAGYFPKEELAMLAGKHSLASLTWIIDRNNIQIDGPTELVMPLEPLAEKIKAFGWHV